MAATWQIGEAIQNRWEVKDIQRGGMGVVYIVYDRSYKQIFAAKTFREDIFTRNPQIAERFKQEALAWVRLDPHPNIVLARFFEHVEGTPFLFLEYVKGGTLADLLRTSKLAENPTRLLSLAIEFCDGIIFAASKGLIAHRDVKPANCLLTEKGSLKITDFGLAKVFDQAEASLNEPQSFAPKVKWGLTATGANAGTWTHMAPEQFVDVGQVDARADIYAFGVILYEMLARRLPFLPRGISFQEVRDSLRIAHCRQPPPPLPAAPDGLATVILKCLAKQPEGRFESFVELRQSLVDVFRHLGGKSIEMAVAAGIPDPILVNSQGTNLARLGMTEEALECYDRALALEPDLADVWNNRAAVLSALGRLNEALESSNRALELNPRFANAWLHRSNAFAVMGKFDDALHCGQRAVQLDPENHILVLGVASVLHRMGQDSESLRECEKALQICPGSSEAWAAKGRCLAELGRTKEAIDALRRASYIEPSNLAYLFEAAEHLLKAGFKNDALELIERFVAQAPNDAVAWNMKGAILFHLDQPEKAIESYNRALVLNPQLHQTWANRGNALFALKSYGQAAASFAEAIRIRPDNSAYYVQRGNALVQVGSCNALQCFEEAHRLGEPRAMVAIETIRKELSLRSYRQTDRDPRASDGWTALEWCNRGKVLRECGRLEDAVACYDRALDLDPLHVTAFNGRGNAYQSLRQLDKALVDQTRAIELATDELLSTLHFNRAVTYDLLDRPERALEDYSECIRRNSKLEKALANRAGVFHRLNRYREALSDLEQALALDGEDAIAYFRRGLIMGDLFCFRRAIADFTKVIELQPTYDDAHIQLGRALAVFGDLRGALSHFRKAAQLGAPEAAALVNRALRELGNKWSPSVNLPSLAAEELFFTGSADEIRRTYENLPPAQLSELIDALNTQLLSAIPADFHQHIKDRAGWLKAIINGFKSETQYSKGKNDIAQ